MMTKDDARPKPNEQVTDEGGGQRPPEDDHGADVPPGDAEQDEDVNPLAPPVNIGAGA